jgi:hypothetical protein
MKSSTMLWLGVGGALGYYLYKGSASAAAATSGLTAAVMSPPFADPTLRNGAIIAPPPDSAQAVDDQTIVPIVQDQDPELETGTDVVRYGAPWRFGAQRANGYGGRRGGRRR